MIIVKEHHKPVGSRFSKRRIKTLGIDDLWAADFVNEKIMEVKKSIIIHVRCYRYFFFLNSLGRTTENWKMGKMLLKVLKIYKKELNLKRCYLCNVTTTYKNWSRLWEQRKPRFHRKTIQRIESLLPKIRKEIIQKLHKVFCKFSNKLINKNSP